MRVRVRSVCPREALGLAQMGPVGRLVHRTGKLRGVAEGLCQNCLAAKACEPILRQALGHLPQEEGREVGQHTRLGENQEPGVVRNQIQPVVLLVRFPSNPPVPRGTLERPILPGGQSQPHAPEQGHIPQPTPRETPEPEIMMRVHQPVEAWPFRRVDQTDRDIGQREALGRFPENRVGVRILRHHAPRMTQPVPECQRKNTRLRIFLRDVFQTRKRPVIKTSPHQEKNLVRARACNRLTRVVNKNVAKNSVGLPWDGTQRGLRIKGLSHKVPPMFSFGVFETLILVKICEFDAILVS